LKRPVERIFKGLFDAACYMDLRRLPELFCGFGGNTVAGRRSIRSHVVRKPGPALRHSRSLRLPSAWSSINATMKFDFGTQFAVPRRSIPAKPATWSFEP
jgi:glycogen debranching enzyme